jgi:hypothetical protein
MHRVPGETLETEGAFEQELVDALRSVLEAPKPPE